MTTRTITILCLLAILVPCGLMFAAPRARKPKPPKTRIAGNDFIVGVNLPWFEGQYHHDLGPSPQHPDWGVWWNPEKVRLYYHDIHEIGFRVVRLWVMEQGEGWVLDDGIITGLDNSFVEHLDEVVRIASQENVKLYLCLTNSWTGVPYPSPVKDLRQQKAYIEKAVKPLAKRFKGNQAVFAFDVFNEIESECLDPNAQHKVTVEQVRTFIRKCSGAIKSEDPKRLVSCGGGYKLLREGSYSGLGLDFYDVHLYNDTGEMPHVNELGVDKPVLIGECGQINTKEDDEIQRRAVMGILRNAYDKGYAGCLIWEYGPKGLYLKICRENGEHKPVVAEIRQFIKSHSSPDKGGDLLKKLAGTKWINSNNVTFEWTKDGRFLHNGTERPCRLLNAQRLQITFGPGHVDTLEFDYGVTQFKQLIKGGPGSFQGHRVN